MLSRVKCILPFFLGIPRLFKLYADFSIFLPSGSLHFKNLSKEITNLRLPPVSPNRSFSTLVWASRITDFISLHHSRLVLLSTVITWVSIFPRNKSPIRFILIQFYYLKKSFDFDHRATLFTDFSLNDFPPVNWPHSCSVSLITLILTFVVISS